ncbi:MAG: SusE domain-containing protein [Sediminibacterium sp.]|nr:SusE domain-containing protein [Sediminibacterium sp.]
MKLLLITPVKRNLPPVGKFILICMVSLFLFACQKEVVNSETIIAASATNSVKNFQVSESGVKLLQGNENMSAIYLRWEAGTPNTYATFTIEAALSGANFSDIIELGTTDQKNITLSVKDFNHQMCRLIPTGATGTIELRIKAVFGKEVPAYSNAVALRVTTYQHFTEYNKTQIMYIPGNFQNWDVASAPKIITTENNGEYEGYVNFTNTYAQFLLVKSEKWDPVKTYTYIGAGKFGFGGSVFSIFGGAGIYLMKASTNTNTWNYTKINTWGINGTAVAAKGTTDPEMSYDAVTKTWNIQLDLVKGDFRIRANNTNAISYGNTVKDGYSVPDNKGENFIIEKAGHYNISLNLTLAGNYTCNLIKIVNPTGTD